MHNIWQVRQGMFQNVFVSESIRFIERVWDGSSEEQLAWTISDGTSV